MIALALFRFLLRSPWSTAMALIGMALGVTSIVSVHLVSANVAARLDAIVPQSLAGYSHYLHRDNLQSNDYFDLRREWRSGNLSSITQLSPLVDATTQLEGNSVRVLGVNLLADSPQVQSRSQTQISGDADEFSWNGVWIDPSLEDRLSIPVNGIIQAPRGTLLADIATAHDLLSWPDNQLSYIGLVLDDPFATIKNIGENLLPGFGSGFPSVAPKLGLESGWQLVGMAQQYPAREFGKSILFNIAALGMLALLVAWLLIYQVAVSWLRRLWPVFERLHVLGVEWRQLRLYFLLSVSSLATLSAALGLAGGWWLAKWLLSVAVPGDAIELDLNQWVVAKAFGSALIVCFLGGAWAFQQSQQRDSRSLPIWMTLVLILIAIGCILTQQSGLAGGFLSIAIFSLVASQAIAPFLSRLRKLASYISGPYLVRIGIREALWHPGELSVSIAGLSLAIATSIGVALMVDSFRADFSRMLDHRLKYDVVASGGDLDLLLEDESFSKAVSRSQSYQQVDIRIEGVLLTLTTTRVDDFEASRYNFKQVLAPGEVLLSEQAAKVLARNVGDSIEVSNKRLEVAGVFSAFGDLQPRMIVDKSSALANVYRSELKTNSVVLNTDNPQELIADLRQVYPNVELRLQSEIRRVALKTFDQTFAITTVLITIAMLVAAISVYIAVTTMRLNRRTGRELLATLGATRYEQLIMNVSLGVGLGIVSIAIALPLGGIFGWILCHVINPRAFGWTIELQFSVEALLLSCAWGMFAAIAAGVIQGGGQEEGAFGGR